jgi:hypothetical protein
MKILFQQLWCAGKRFALMRRIVIVFCVVSLCGCYSASLSRPYVEFGSGWSSEVWGRAQRITFQDIDIFVKASNRVSKVNDETKRDTFAVSLQFIPEIEDDLEFVPSEVTLLIPGQNPMKPTRVDRMIPLGYSIHLDIWDCGHGQLETFEPGKRYVVRKGFCVNLYFDTRPPSPDTEFTLRLPDLIRNDVRISVPDLHFKKDTVGIYDFL